MQIDGCTVPRPFLDAVLLYTMQCHFYFVLNSELRLLQSTAIPPELSNAIYLAWQGYVRLLLKGLGMCPLFDGEVFRVVPLWLTRPYGSPCLHRRMRTWLSLRQDALTSD